MSKLGSAALPFILLPVLDSYGPVAFFVVISAATAGAALIVASLAERATGAPLHTMDGSLIT